MIRALWAGQLLSVSSTRRQHPSDTGLLLRSAAHSRGRRSRQRRPLSAQPLGTQVTKHSRDLQLAAARYVLGDLSSAELARIADGLLDQGIYSMAIGELATTRHLVMADAGPLFEQALRDLKVEMPSREEAVWVLLRHHIGRIAYEDVAPREGLRSVMDVYNRAAPQAHCHTYVGDSHGIQQLVGAYWEYDDLEVRPVGASLETLRRFGRLTTQLYVLRQNGLANMGPSKPLERPARPRVRTSYSPAAAAQRRAVRPGESAL